MRPPYRYACLENDAYGGHLESLQVVDEHVGHPEVVDEVQVNRVQEVRVQGAETWAYE